MKAPCRIAVVGGGPTGCLAGALLARAGHEVELFERRARTDGLETDGDRSINLAIPESTIGALRDLGVGDALTSSAVPLLGRLTHARSGEITSSPYADPATSEFDAPYRGRSRSPLHPNEPPSSVRRDVLLRTLLDLAEREPLLTLRHRHRLVDADLEAGRLEFDAHGSPRSVVVDLVVGADGATSTVRGIMAARPGFRAEVRRPGIRYRELRIEAADAAILAPRQFHLWPRAGFLLAALPNPGTTFTFTLFAGRSAFSVLDAVDEPGARIELFEREFPDLAELVGHAALRNDVVASSSSHPLTSVRCRPWHLGLAVLAGDACHALLPFSGRGTCEGLADVLELVRCIGDAGVKEPGAAFEEYERLRRPGVEAVADFTDALAPLLLSLLPESGLSAAL
ncbi:MAG: NAD(P)/FAD-dependent oxidoreductase [Gemmatimonadales bacterium]